MNSRTQHLDTYLAACAAYTATLLAFESDADAAIVYSGVVNITIPGTFAGVYLNMVTGATSTSFASNPGADFNPYYGGSRLWAPANIGAIVGTGNQASALPQRGFVGPYVGPASNFINGTPVFTTNFTSGVATFAGVRFLRESDSVTLYGWVRMIKSSSNTLPGMILDYAYEDNGGAIPSSGSLAILALGACACWGRRRAS